MSNEYHLADGSPRYGSHLAKAIDRRLTGSWADRENPLVTALRAAHPEELVAARALVAPQLGSQRQWRMKAQAIRDRHLAPTMRRRRAAGSAREILFLRIVLMIVLIAPPLYIVATSMEDLIKLTLTGVACVAAAFAGVHFVTIRSRVPAMPNIRGPWLAELREDVLNATLPAILLSKDVIVESRTVAAAERGIKSMRAAHIAVEALQG